MSVILDKVAALDIDGWLRGLFSAAISGGASAVVGGITISGIDPEHYSFYTAKFYIVVGILFATNAVVSMAKFLSATPLPGLKQVERTIEVTIPATKDSPKVVETTKETHVEPLNPADQTVASSAATPSARPLPPAA